jgi:hypothetical protein
MPKDIQLTKYDIWGVNLVQSFFSSLVRGTLLSFLKSDELERFLHGTPGGSFGSKIPGGGPGSKFPGTGAMSPLDTLHQMFGSIASGFGEVDNPGGFNTATQPVEDVGSIPSPSRVQSITVRGEEMTVQSTGRQDIYSEGRNSDTGQKVATHITYYDNGIKDRVDITSDGAGGTWWDMSRTQNGVTRTIHSHHEIDSPGEDGGGDTNSDRNPLGSIDIRGLQSVGQMLKGVEHPAKDGKELDPNFKKGQYLKDIDKDRLGRVAPALKTLDPNSGIDPLTQLNIDPGTLHTRSKEDDRIDPNTGIKPVPGTGK